MYINEPRLLGANSTNLRHLNCSFLMCWTFFSKVPILASNLLHVSHFNVDDPKGNRCGTIQTKHHHHSHLIQNSTNTSWHLLFINLKLSGWKYQSMFVFHTLGSLLRQHPMTWFHIHTCSAKGIEACILTPPCQLLRLEIFVVRMGHSSPNWRWYSLKFCFNRQTHMHIYNTVQYTAQQYNTLHNNTIRCTANLHSVYYPAYKIWYIKNITCMTPITILRMIVDVYFQIPYIYIYTYCKILQVHM